MITRKDIAIMLERQVRTGFLVGQREAPTMRQAFVQETQSSAAFEAYGDFGAFPWPVQNAGKPGAGGEDERTGAAVVNKMNEGGAIQVIGGETQGLFIYNVDWQIGIGVYHNAIDDDQSGDLESWAQGAAVNFERHKDYLAFDALNNGEATTKYGACYDKLSFFNDSHVDPGAEYQTAQDNKFALSLNLDNFETVKVAASKFMDSRGQPVGLNHRLLIVPSDLERTSAQIAANREAYDTANREMNPYAGNVSVMVAPGSYLDTTAWFLIDTTLPQKPIILQNRQQPQLVVWDDETQGSGIRYFVWKARYAVGYGDWRLAVQGNS